MLVNNNLQQIDTSLPMAYYLKTEVVMELTKTQRAVALVDQGMKAFAAAREVGVAPNAVYLALKKRREAAAAGFVDCPCCGTLVPAEKINRGVLNTDAGE